MPSTEVGSLAKLVASLWATPPSRHSYQATLFLRSFLLERPAGNVVVYTSPGLAPAAKQIRELGGATRLLVSHGPEAMYGQPGPDVPVFVHERGRRETARSVRVAGVFTGRQLIDDDLEVIPTPGHTPGATSYLWDDGSHRFLSLALVRELDFDVLVPWGTTQPDACFALVDKGDIRSRIDTIIARVEADAAN